MENLNINNSLDEDGSESENEIDFNIFNIIEIETNQMNIQVNTIKPKDEIKSIKSLTLSDNRSLRLNPNDRNNEFEVVVPYIGKKRLRKVFRAKKRKEEGK